MMEKNVNVSASAEELVTTDKFQWGDLWKKEDWQTVRIGFIAFAVAIFFTAHTDGKIPLQNGRTCYILSMAAG